MLTVGDETITRLILATGWKPGDPINDAAVRLWMGAVAGECLRAIETVRTRYAPKPGMYLSDDVLLASRTTADNCARAVRSALEDAT